MSYRAHIYGLVGELDAAIAQLEILLSEPGYYTAAGMSLNPVWDPLRDHPGFQALLVKNEG